MTHTVGRSLPADDQLRLAEKIALEISEAQVAGLMELMRCFEFFRQHPAFGGAKAAHHAGAFLKACCLDIDFYEVGKVAERGTWIVGCEVIERDQIARCLEALAGGDDTVFRL